MKFFHHTIKTLLTFSRGERIGLAVLFVLLLLVLWYPVLKPDPAAPEYAALAEYMRRIDSLSMHADLDSTNKQSPPLFAERRNYDNKRPANTPLFAFDPNTADSAIFVRLGFSPKQASVIIRYRARGGKFRSPDDFAKVYVVNEKMFLRLKPYITISPDDTVILAASVKKKEEVVKTFHIVELNSADTTVLKTVRGIGSYSAKVIVEMRAKLGGFTHMEQLLEIRGMNEERLQSLRDQVSIDQNLVRKINLKNADEKILKSHPYIGAYAARGILLFRKNNPACTLDDLLVNNILQKSQAEKLIGYVEE